jgi:hypothetical protein
VKIKEISSESKKKKEHNKLNLYIGSPISERFWVISKQKGSNKESTRAEEHLTVDLLVEQVAMTRVQEHFTVDFLVELF